MPVEIFSTDSLVEAHPGVHWLRNRAVTPVKARAGTCAGVKAIARTAAEKGVAVESPAQTTLA